MCRMPSPLAVALVGLAVAVSTVTAEAQTNEISLGSVALNVADIAYAEKFYSETFGLVRTFQYPPEGDDPIEVGLGRPGQPGGPVILFLSDLDGYEFELYQPAPGGE